MSGTISRGVSVVTAGHNETIRDAAPLLNIPVWGKVRVRVRGCGFFFDLRDARR